jgi:DNA-binding protein YbaB
MAVVLYDEDAVQVLKSFRPYLGPQGEKVADLLDEFLKLLSSEPAQNYIITLQNPLNGAVRILISGKFQVLGVKINPRLARNVPQLEELVGVAVEDALQKGSDLIKSEAQKLLGGSVD